MAEKTARTYKPFDGKISEFHKSIEGMLPPEFAEHHRKARKEMLLAWRSMIDASLERMDDPKKKD
jgi:hypothetical protein